MTENEKILKLKETIPNFYALGERIGRKRFEAVPALLLCAWAFLPIYIIIRFGIESIGIEERFHGVTMAMYAWYQPVWVNAFSWLGRLTILVAIVCLVVKMWNCENIWLCLKKNIWFVFLIALLIWMFICLWKSGMFSDEWRGTNYRYDGMFSQLVYAALFICAGSVLDRSWLRRFFRIFGLAANLSAILVICQYYEVKAVYDIYPFDRAAVFWQFNHCGYYLAMSTIILTALFVYEESMKWRIAYAASIALLFAALIYNNTFGCYLAVLVAMIFVYIIYKCSGRKLNWQSFIPCIIIVVLTIAMFRIVIENFSTLNSDMENIMEGNEALMGAGTGRMTLWINAVERIAKSPIFGYGAEGFYFRFPNSPVVDRPHCEFLQYAAFYGIPGLILYLGALFSLFFARIKELKNLDINILVAASGMFVYLASSCFGNTMFYTSPYFFIFFGLVAFNKVQEKL